MAKKHCDVKIFDPGKEHIIPILPSQNFSVFLSGPTPRVRCASPFFQLTSTSIHEKYTVFHFKQTKDLSVWSRVSKVFLGEIFFTRVDTCGPAPVEQSGNLLVYLNATRQTDLITVINPDQANLKVFPSSIIEVVVYDYHYSSSWDITTILGFDGLKFEMVASEKIDPTTSPFTWNQSDSNYTCYPRSPMLTSALPVFEHHYWFKLDRACIHKIIHLPNGTYGAGKILFDTKEDEIDFKILNVILSVRGSKNHKTDNWLTETPPLAQKMRVLKPNIGQTPGRPKNTLLVQNIMLDKKADCELDSQNILYVNVN